MMAWFLGLIAIWIALGWALLVWGARPRGRKFRRSVSTRVCTVGQRVKVSLTLTAPPSRHPPPPLDVVMLLDHSSSMGAAPGSPLQMMLRAAGNFLRQLSPDSRVAVVGFNQVPSVHCTLAATPAQARSALQAISPGGATSIAAALNQAVELLAHGRPGMDKVVVLCSDGQDDIAEIADALARLKAIPSVRVLAVGFGDEVIHATFLAMVADRQDYFHLTRARDMDDVFQRLAKEVNGPTGLLAAVTEPVATPVPFALIGDTMPFATVEGNRLVWSLSGAEGDTAAEYGVEARCVGWLRPVEGKAFADWILHDGGREPVDGPASPRILVLPRGFGWAWPLFNPLAMILLGRLWPCPHPDQQKSRPPFDTVAVPELPPLPPIPAEPENPLSVRPSLVIGLGEMGEDLVSALKFRLADRHIPDTTTRMLCVRLGQPPSRLTALAPRVPLDARELLTVDLDLRPHMEAQVSRLRGGPHAWAPLESWLAETCPQTTSHGTNDRRKARFAALIDAPRLVREIGMALESLDSPQVILAGRADDPETSGILGEIAHICAEQGRPVTAILTRSSAVPAVLPARRGLARELERLLSLRGEKIQSDRGAVASHLFDRCLVVGSPHDTEGEQADKALEAMFSLLMGDALDQAAAPTAEARVQLVEIAARTLPQELLWRWARARCLREVMIQTALGFTPGPKGMTGNPPTEQEVREALARFWSPGGQDTLPAILILARHHLGLGQTEPPAPSLGERAAYHQLEEFCDSERMAFHHCLRTWTQAEINRAAATGRLGIILLPLSIQALRDQLAVTRGYCVRRVADSAGHPEDMAAALLGEFDARLDHLQREVAAWLNGLGGPTLLGRGSLLRAFAAEILDDETEARNQLDFFPLPWPEVEAAFAAWSADISGPLLRRFSFSVEMDARNHLRIRPAGLTAAATPDDVRVEIIRLLDSYRPVVTRWPRPEWFGAPMALAAGQWQATGRFADTVAPEASAVEVDDKDDPFRVAAFRMETVSVREAFGHGMDFDGPADFVWAEDAIAQRIADRIANQFQRKPRPFSPAAVTLLRAPEVLAEAAREIADGNIRSDHGGVVLVRGGSTYRLAPPGSEPFATAVAQLSTGCSLDRETLPPATGQHRPAVTPEALAEAAATRLGTPLGANPDMWKDVILGAALHVSDRLSDGEPV
ncbi:vWA domain-containing protein [Paramagnetospirillum magneticum]|nr:vWA domain-containing protein [Paramagnetospirillum magneticum]